MRWGSSVMASYMCICEVSNHDFYHCFAFWVVIDFLHLLLGLGLFSIRIYKYVQSDQRSTPRPVHVSNQIPMNDIAHQQIYKQATHQNNHEVHIQYMTKAIINPARTEKNMSSKQESHI